MDLFLKTTQIRRRAFSDLKKNYSTSADWREKLKNRDKAKQIEVMAGYTICMPGQKEPDEKVDEPHKEIPLENKWAQKGKNQEK